MSASSATHHGSHAATIWDATSGAMPPATRSSPEMAVSRSTSVTKMLDVPPSGGSSPHQDIARSENPPNAQTPAQDMRVADDGRHPLERSRRPRPLQTNDQAFR